MSTGSAFMKRWSRNWQPRVATGVAALVGVAAGAGVIAATAKPSSTAPKASTPATADDGAQATTPTAPTQSNPGFPWDDDDSAGSSDSGFQPAPFDSGSSNFGGPPQASTRAS